MRDARPVGEGFCAEESFSTSFETVVLRKDTALLPNTPSFNLLSLLVIQVT